jgi:hypothetical protein
MTSQQFVSVQTPIINATIDEYVRLGETGVNGLKTILALGGFYSTLITQEQIDFVIEHPEMNHPETVATFMKMKPGYLINYLIDFAEVMTSDEINAVLLHEDAHILLNHFQNVSGEKFTVGNGRTILLDTEKEIAADAYAAAIVGKSTMANALRTMIKAQAKFIQELFKPDLDVDAFVASVLEDDGIKTRLNALN